MKNLHKKLKNKKLLLFILTIIMCLGVSYAAIYFVYFKEDSRINKIETGLVTIDYVEGNGEINLTNTLPVLDEVGLASEPYSFIVKNTSAVPINLKVELIPDSENTLHEGAIRYGLYKDGELIQLDNLQNLENNILYLYQEMPAGKTIEFKLYIWVDYYYETPNETFKAQIKVTGESFDIIYEPTGSEYIISTLNTEGLVAVNTDGTLYNETGEIREYRYSGPSVNNYIIFNDDGDAITEANELWRIVGVFKNSNGQWNLKLMRDTVLTSEEMPSTYTIKGTTFDIGVEGSCYWNSIKTGPNYNDWTRAGLQYFLNTEKDDNGVSGYYSTFTSAAKKLIDENYEYNLGNVNYDSTTIEAYDAERKTTICSSSITSNSHNSNCNIWNGNELVWKGAVGLLYPSDYGYSVNSEYWNITMYKTGYNTAQSDDIIPKNTSWMQVTTAHSGGEWFLSPSSYSATSAIYWTMNGNINSYYTPNYLSVHVVINLKPQAMIDGNHEGSKNDPYIIIED